MNVDEEIPSFIEPIYVNGRKILYKKNKNCKDEHKVLCAEEIILKR